MGAREERFNDYAGFVDKFKYKHTTDDCYTPADIYEVVLDFAKGLPLFPVDAPVVRPFYPGGDFENFDYPDGCVVVDNPPFSILAKVIKFYQDRGIKFFLFGPALTLFSSREDVTFVVVDTSIFYDNGARINTGFVTNLDQVNRIIIANDLRKKLASCYSQTSRTKKVKRYHYDNHIKTAALLHRHCGAGNPDYFVKKKECFYFGGRTGSGQKLFGNGFLVSDRVIDRLGAIEYETEGAIPVTLTDKERRIIEELNKNYDGRCIKI